MSKLWVCVLGVLSLGVASCKPPPPYVGNYHVLGTDSVKQGLVQLEAQDASERALSPDQSDADLKRMETVYAAVAVRIDGDGTCHMHSSAGRGMDVDGTYTVSGNKLTVKWPHGEVQNLTFNQAEGKLMNDSSNPGSMSYVKQ